MGVARGCETSFLRHILCGYPTYRTRNTVLNRNAALAYGRYNGI